MKSETLIPLAILAFTVFGLGFVFAPSCSIKPALINWERREPGAPILPWRKKHEPKEVTP